MAARVIDAALKQATRVPLGVAERAAEVAQIARDAAADYESEYEVGSDDGAGAGGCGD